MPTLKVNYVSQKTNTAAYSINDCGPACVAMFLHTMGINKTVDQMYKDAGITATTALAVSTLQKFALVYDLTLDRYNNAEPNVLKAWIDEGKPALLLVDYKPVMKANLHESVINGGHFVVVVGYTEDSFVVHDPYWNNQGGAYRVWPNDVLLESWKQAGTQYQRIALVPNKYFCHFRSGFGVVDHPLDGYVVEFYDQDGLVLFKTKPFCTELLAATYGKFQMEIMDNEK